MQISPNWSVGELCIEGNLNSEFPNTIKHNKFYILLEKNSEYKTTIKYYFMVS